MGNKLEEHIIQLKEQQMYKIEGTTITLTRGDSFYSEIKIKTAAGAAYTPQAGESVRFALKRFYTDTEPLILKTIPTDTLLLYLAPEETKALAVGEYVYDVELTRANGDVDTFIHEAKFIVSYEVH